MKIDVLVAEIGPSIPLDTIALFFCLGRIAFEFAITRGTVLSVVECFCLQKCIETTITQGPMG